jgi:hypothetical protein
MKTIISVFFVAVLSVGAATNAVVGAFNYPSAKVTVRVVDENQQPVNHADVTLGFGDTSVEGLTDVHGLFNGEGPCGAAGMGSRIIKDGYYNGAAPIPRFVDLDEAHNRWKPWNETYTAILRPIGKPLALYAKKVRTNIPVLEQPCGFDLEVGDWVVPYGKGVKSDFIFNVQDRKLEDTENFESQGELAFTNPGDGLQQTSMSANGTNSFFEWERQAPLSGYQTNYHLYNTWWERKGQKGTQNFKFGGKEWEGYFFRVRTVVQDGQVVSAHYCKIRGGIEIDPRWAPTCTIAFAYYFNPTPNDRNLEWKVGNNLFKGLNDEQTPDRP